jgi:hypothetical protein
MWGRAEQATMMWDRAGSGAILQRRASVGEALVSYINVAPSKRRHIYDGMTDA